MDKQKIDINFKLCLVFQCVKDEDLVENPTSYDRFGLLSKWFQLRSSQHRKCYQDVTHSGMLIRAKERCERELAGPNESQLVEGTGYEARQTSKEQTKMPKFKLEGPRPSTVTMHELRNQHVSIGQSLSSE